jgi:hypothetical protein
MMRYLLLLAIPMILGACSKGLPPLRTWEVAEANAGSSRVSFSFEAPHREPSKGYWDYKLGFVLPIDTQFDLTGQVEIFASSGELQDSFRFDSATRSTWLQDKNRISHLLVGNLGIRDGEAFRIELMFDQPLSNDVGVVLHFLSHQATPIQLIKAANKSEMATPRKPSD